jgi:hypothetical protein
MSNLSELLPTGGGQNAVDFVASGTLSSGQTVALKSDGTVEPISSGSVSGTPTAANSSTVNVVRSTYDPDLNKVIIIYSDAGNSSYGTYVIGTVSGTSITYTTPTVYVSENTSSSQSVTYDTNSNKVVFAYRKGNGYGAVKVGTVSSTSITFGSEVVFNVSNSTYIECTFDATNNKIIIVYRNVGNSSYGTAIVGTVSGTSISFGSPVVFEAANTYSPLPIYDPVNGKIVVYYRDGGNSFYTTAIVGTVSGTSISFGSPTIIVSLSSSSHAANYDTSAQKFAGFYRSGSDGVGVVFSVSGTSISLGNTTSFDVGLTPYRWTSAYNAVSQASLLAYVQNANLISKYILATISGTTITFSSSETFDTVVVGQEPFGVIYDSLAQASVVSYKGDSSYVYSTVINTDVSNIANFIGITAGAISDTATGAVNVYGGINEAQTGLTIGSDYYVQDDGSLSTTASSVKVGQAISATTINMMDLT